MRLTPEQFEILSDIVDRFLDAINLEKKKKQGIKTAPPVFQKDAVI